MEAEHINQIGTQLTDLSASDRSLTGVSLTTMPNPND